MKNIQDAIQCIQAKKLDDAIRFLTPLFESKPSLIGHEEMTAIANDFSLMKQFMLQGVKDPERENLYLGLLQRLYKVAANLEISWRCKNLDIYVNAFRASDHQNSSHDFIQSVLENFVSDVAMLSLESESVRNDKRTEIFERHQHFMDRLFSTILVSCQWKSADAKFYESILTSPLVDLNDQLLIISAISISTMNVFDINKFKVLINIYSSALDENVKQRALVGWVLSIVDNLEIFPEQTNLIATVCKEEKVKLELLELQIQLFSCLDAEKDNEKIQQDIMPNLMNNSGFTINRFGISETDEDKMENILNPNADDEKMEIIEKNIQKMMKMQKEGSDIYFGGFKQMKRFAFFSKISNWFMPFVIDHPELNSVRNKLQDSAFLNLLFKQNTFCESDKYSLALALSSIIDRLPKNVLEMLNTNDSFAFAGGTIPEEEKTAYIRRMYLQDLFRFYRIHQEYRSDIVNPFHKTNHHIIYFFTKKIFENIALESQKIRLGMYLYRHSRHTELYNLLESFSSENHKYNTLKGYSYLYRNEFKRAYFYFDKVLVLAPDNAWALNGKVNAALRSEDYETAASTYSKLLELNPNRQHYILNQSIALIKLDRANEPLNALYKLEFENPNDKKVKRILAWALLCDGQTAKAVEHYKALLSDNPSDSDYLNAGYAHWIEGDIAQACNCFQTWKQICKDKELIEEFRKDDYLLNKVNISETDRELMISLTNE